MKFKPFILFAEVGQLKVKNNKVMCHLSIKLSNIHVFDPNPIHTSDKIVAKHIQ